MTSKQKSRDCRSCANYDAYYRALIFKLQEVNKGKCVKSDIIVSREQVCENWQEREKPPINKEVLDEIIKNLEFILNTVKD